VTVRAKFKVQSVTHNAPAGTEKSGSVVLTPVTSGSEENKVFWKYTPSGRIEMQVSNMDALAQFQPGQEFYVDFTPAEPAVG
jgi:hypothetical protein